MTLHRRLLIIPSITRGSQCFRFGVKFGKKPTGVLERLTNGNGFASDLRVSADGKTAVYLKWHSDWHGTPVESDPYLLDVQSHRLTLLKISGLN